MNLIRPTPQQERWLAIAARFPHHRDHPAVREGTGPWRGAGLMTRLAMFVLGVFIACSASGSVWMLAPAGRLLATGVLLALSAEWLIARRHLAGAGIEEALALGGYLSLTFSFADLLGQGGDARFALAAAIGFGAAGWRLRNPLCTTLMALSLSLCIAMALDGAHRDWALPNTAVGAVASYTLAVAALLAGARVLQRPSTDRMLDWLVVVMPVAGYCWSAADAGAPLHRADLAAAGIARLCVPAAPLAFATVALATGLRRRTHAPLIAAMLCIACAAFELRELTGLSLTSRLLLWGCVLLLLAVALDRVLRTARRGITSQRLAADEGASDLLPMAGAAMLGPQARVATADSFQGQGGGFGGGGASGQY